MRRDIQASNFDVFVSDNTTSVEEWRRALKAPLSELPELSPAQMEIVKKFGVKEEEYKRGVLAGIYGNRRMHQRGVDLGKAIGSILEGLAGPYNLKAVIAEFAKERWVARVQAPDKIVNIAIDRDLADDVVDSDTVQDQERLKILLLKSLGHPELLRTH